ncbi:MAG: class II aldolase/adducin family protein [Kiritimatiellaeota bacterium]|nr:class II aldolase/adducin family protein [Kiritimatiellota bacterium]
MDILRAITVLSHEFGTADYVQAGGGNTSCKNKTTLWVKPSGTTLLGLSMEAFIAMDRAALDKLYAVEPPASPAEREELVKDMMAQAVLPETPGRASVEAPLHNALSARYVVHTHPAAVNGLTCALGGRAAAARLFPDALWVPYVDPGYTLCMVVRKAVQDYKAVNGEEPKLLFLENHGVFVCADTPEEIRAIYGRVMNTLARAYAEHGIHQDVPVEKHPIPDELVARWRKVLAEAFGDDATAVVARNRFRVVSGPLSPDHIVYAKSYPFDGVLTVENLRAFKEARGYAPRIVLTDHAVLGVAATEKNARLALTLAMDGAIVRRLARAFGGLQLLGDASRAFIENWEVESYRAKQV